MPKVEVFFDHSCPYCYKGLGYLKELLPKYPNVEIDWKPVEAHPKNEEPEHKPYVDLAVRGALFIREAGGDENAYNDSLFHAYFEKRQSPEDISVLAKCAGAAGVDTEAFKQALSDKKLEKEGLKANDYAYVTKKVWAVPTFICAADIEKRLDSVAGVGVTKAQLDAFLASMN